MSEGAHSYYTHPVFGTPCSRQRHVQVQNTLAGKCAFHKTRDRVADSDYCEECFKKCHGHKEPIRPKQRWFGIDWSQSNDVIASKFGVTRTAVIYQRRKHCGSVPLQYTPKCGPRKAVCQPVIQPEIGPQEREAARIKVSKAIASGKLRRKPCAVCNSRPTQAHHFDYTKALEVIWLCKKHHAALHIAANKVLRVQRGVAA